MLYDYCDSHKVPYKKVGKLVVARDNQRSYIEGLHLKAQSFEWPSSTPSSLHNKPVLPTELISGGQARELEPDLSKDITAALWSPETGIVDSHSFMESLEKDIAESEGGELAYRTRVVRVDPHREGGWVVQTVTGEEEEGDAIHAGTVINSSGLSAHLILNALLPKEARIPMFYARGSYASYKGSGVNNVSHLIYPCPDTGRTVHGFQSLGTHLTLDLQGKIRFGPDLDWLDPPNNESEADVVEDADPDFWQKHLIPDDTRLSMMHDAVKEYLPEVSTEGLQPDYCGIRPKLVGPQGGFRDFEFHIHYADQFLKNPGPQDKVLRPMISLLGIESPGLTSSLAIAKLVVDGMLGRQNGHTAE